MTSTSQETESSDLKSLAIVLLLAAVLGIVVVTWLQIAQGPSAATVARNVGASECVNTGYRLENRLTESSDRLYDCLLQGKRKCVAYAGGSGRDATFEAAVAFSDTLGGERPRCAQ